MATYRKEINLASLAKSENLKFKMVLDLGKIAVMAEVNLRQGITRNTDGTLTFVVWVELESVSPVRFAVEDGEG